LDTNGDGLLNDRLRTTNGLILEGAAGDHRTAIAISPQYQSDLDHFLALYLESCQCSQPTIGRTTFRASGLSTLDVGIGRSFALTNVISMRFRVDAFNALNHANFGIPVRLLGAPGFGTAVDTAAPNRRPQLNLQLSF